MKKILFLTIALSLIATAAMAHDVTGRMGLGFVSTDAPVGIRYWMNERIGIDAGVGFKSVDGGDSTRTTLTTFVLDAGAPFVFNAMGDRVNFLIRPGIQLATGDEAIDSGGQAGKVKGTSFKFTASLEFEVFVTDDFSVSAAHGVAIYVSSPDRGDDATSFGLFGNNWTGFGFHYYLKNK